MAIKAISEFTVQPDRREEFVSLFESLVAQHQSPMRSAGCSASTIFAVVDDPDKAVEISDWESAEARDAMAQSEAMAAFSPLFEMLASPPIVTVVRPPQLG
jgi:quinol monooxygenase YgiN